LSNKTNILVLGSTGGIGRAVIAKLQEIDIYSVTGWSSEDLDLNHPLKIFQKDLSCYDVIINCAGHSQGTYLGFLNNSNENQLSQITVNYTSNLFLCKHFANSVNKGKYIWCNSTSTDNPRPFHSVYAGTKAASSFSLNLIAKEAEHINIVDVKIGLVHTNLRYRNFNGSKTMEEVEKSYSDFPQKMVGLDQVADTIVYAIENDICEITIK
jgi:short-subunit dehydrogenase